MSSVFVYQFWNPDCRPCAVLKPMFGVMAEDFADSVTWVSVNTHNDTNGYKDTYGVTVVPTLVTVIRDAAGNDIKINRHSGSSVPEYYHLVRVAVMESKQ